MEDELVRLWPTTAINDVKVHMRKKFKRAFSSSSLEAKARRLGLTKNYTAPAWSQDELDLVKKLRPTNTLMEIQSILKRMLGSERSAIAIERKAARLGWTYQGLGNENFVAAPSEMDISQSQALSRICALKEEYKTPCEYRPIGIIPRDKIARKILCIADLHIPFDRDDLVYDIVHTHKDADILVIAGDLLDLYAVSTWPHERVIVLQKEYEIALEYLKVFSKMFKQVVVIRGNHEYRLNRYFHTNLSPSVSFMVSKDILARLCNGEIYNNDGEIIERLNFKNIYYDNGPEAWFAKIGKTIFVHPMSYSGVEAKTVVTAQEFFMEREDIDCIVSAHTHHQAKVLSRSKLCIETGSLCLPLDYEKQGKLKFKPQDLGYAVLYQDARGNCDFNRSQAVYLGTQYPIKLDHDAFVRAQGVKHGRAEERG